MSVNHYTTYSKSLGNRARTNGSVYFPQGVSDSEEVVNPYLHAATNTVNPLHVSSIFCHYKNDMDNKGLTHLRHAAYGYVAFSRVRWHVLNESLLDAAALSH